MKPGISFIIQKPSPDLDTEAYDGNKVYIRGVVHSLSGPADMDTLGVLVPYSVLNFVRRAFDDDDKYRAEILVGDVLYKFYRKPSRDLVPKEEDNTPLEKFQDEQRALEKFKAKNPGIIPGGAGSGNAIDQALDLVKPPDFPKCDSDPGYLCPEECPGALACLRVTNPDAYNAIREGNATF